MQAIICALLLLLPATTFCTEASFRNTGDKDAEDEFAPYQISLQSISKQQYLCGGAILSDRYILTAANCLGNLGVPWEEYVVVAGTNNWTDAGAKYYIEKIFVPCNFHKPYPQNDIAVLRLNDSIVWNNKTQPIKFTHSKTLKDGDPVVLTGWGLFQQNRNDFPEKLQKLNQFILSNEECNKNWIKKGEINIGHICSTKKKDEGVCGVHPGSALVNKNKELIGITNMLAKVYDCAAETPFVYASTLYHNDWINFVMGL